MAIEPFFLRYSKLNNWTWKFKARAMAKIKTTGRWLNISWWKRHNMKSWSEAIKSWWRHQMETFSALLALCEGNHRSPVDSPHKGPWLRSLMFPFTCGWTNGFENNRDAGDLKRHRTHFDVTVTCTNVCGRLCRSIHYKPINLPLQLMGILATLSVNSINSMA